MHTYMHTCMHVQYIHAYSAVATPSWGSFLRRHQIHTYIHAHIHVQVLHVHEEVSRDFIKTQEAAHWECLCLSQNNRTEDVSVWVWITELKVSMSESEQQNRRYLYVLRHNSRAVDVVVNRHVKAWRTCVCIHTWEFFCLCTCACKRWLTHNMSMHIYTYIHTYPTSQGGTGHISEVYIHTYVHMEYLHQLFW